MKNLQVALIEDVGEEDYKNLFDLSIRLSNYITELFKDKETGETPDDFWWHRSCATRPAFHHLCFAYKATVYSCLIGSIVDGQIYIPAQDWNNNQRETKEYGLQSCVIPIDATGEAIDVLPILDANTLEPVDFKSENLNDPLSEWELHCIGVNNVNNYLADNGYTHIQSCDLPKMKPSIWFTDSEGKRSYVIVRSIAIGCNEDPYTISKNLVDNFTEQGIKGYFVNIKWANIFGSSGLFNEKQVYHSSLVKNAIELEPIEDVERNHKNIKIVPEDLYEVKPY